MKAIFNAILTHGNRERPVEDGSDRLPRAKDVVYRTGSR